MSGHAYEPPVAPDTTGLVTEDDEPVDSFLAEKGQRLLTSALYASWNGPPADSDEVAPRKFLAAANVGFFATLEAPPLVPDVMVSTDTSVDALTPGSKEQRSYFLWEIGKPPEVVIEIVSDKKGDELKSKRRKYARAHVSHYVVWDPRGVYGDRELRVFSLSGDLLQELDLVQDGPCILSELDLGVCLWEGVFENTHARWLRFTDGRGRLLPTATELAATERTRADAERARADEERARADGLAAKLRALGVDPDA